ncbi:MAG TPA: hypothetical protein GXZ27_01455 [Thermoanaerobacterales bacterium]|jgi:sarcosine reductase|nr:hypothetical protein [Thermoanaerobacterales bacterium]
MQLQIAEYPVSSLEWGDENKYNDGKLIINKDSILSYLKSSNELDELIVTDLDLILPETSTRVINVFDVLPAYARLGEGVSNFPGFLEPFQIAGHGNSATLSNFSILATSSRPSRYNKVMDKSGLGAEISPYGGHFHLALQAEPRNSDMSNTEYYKHLKKIGLRIGTYLSKLAAEVRPANTLFYTLEAHPSGLPKVAYVCMLAALQNWDKGESILYGDNLSGMLPTVLHPNEILDGAVIAPNFNLGIDTYSFLNNPVIQELYKKHGKEIDFVGVVVCVSHVTRNQRERSIGMTANLAANVLGADLAIITKVGGGIPESDVMLTIESLERIKVKTTAIMWAHLGNGTIQDILTAYSPAANALVSAGINDALVNLPGQEKVIGGNEIEPLSDDPKAKPQNPHSAIQVRCREICGVINQLGASRVALEEI